MERTVSVIVTARDAAEFLEPCLESIANSTHSDLQVIAVNDGSSDETGSTLDSWAQRDTRFEVFHTEPLGRRSALELAHGKAEGAFQCWVDADDLVDPRAIAACITKLDDEHQLVYTHRWLLKEDSKNPHAKNKVAYRAQKLLVANMIFHLRMFTTELFDEGGGVGDFESAIDWDMNLRMTELTTPRCIPQMLYTYRVRPGRMSSRPEQRECGERAVRNAIERRGLDLELVVRGDRWELHQKRRPTLRLP